MAVALAANVALLVSLVVGVVAAFLWTSTSLAIAVFWLIGFAAFAAPFLEEPDHPRDAGEVVEGPAADRARHEIERLCALADLPAPALRVHASSRASIWTTTLADGGPSVHVTEALLESLPPAELRAVLAHEVGHLINRDSFLLSALLVVPGALLHGFRVADEVVEEHPWVRALDLPGTWALITAPIAGLMMLAVRVLSRYRELVADSTAAVLTGSPAALAAALTRIDPKVDLPPSRDLRLRDGFADLRIVPLRRETETPILRLWNTHPPLKERLLRLEAMAGVTAPGHRFDA